MNPYLITIIIFICIIGTTILFYHIVYDDDLIFPAIDNDTLLLIIFICIIDIIILAAFYRRHIINTIKPRIGGIIFGSLIFFVMFSIPAQQFYSSDKEWNKFWSHNWARIYCNGALMYMHLNEAEKDCHPGPEDKFFMSELEMLAEYPVYQMILNTVPFIYPIITVFLIIAAISITKKEPLRSIEEEDEIR